MKSEKDIEYDKRLETFNNIMDDFKNFSKNQKNADGNFSNTPEFMSNLAIALKMLDENKEINEIADKTGFSLDTLNSIKISEIDYD